MPGNVPENRPERQDLAGDPPSTVRPGRPVRGAAAGGGPAARAPSAQHAAEITDVWSWTGRKYRVRALVLLSVNFVLFCGLCTFTHWLHVARMFDFAWDAYATPFRFWGAQTQNLYDFILFPVSVDLTPMYAVVIGLLLAAIVVVPISVSILYRFRSALPFTAAVFVFAHLPWMAITLLGSCVLASVKPFRMKFRYGSALLAMLPVLVYLYMATRGANDPLSASISPERKLLLAGPWILAILAACVMLAVIIFIARLVNYRPGAVAPVIAVMFATPFLLFRSYVGTDELQYRILEAEYGPRSERFKPVRDVTEEVFVLVHRWTDPSASTKSQRARLAEFLEQEQSARRRIPQHFLLKLLDDRRDAYDACADFIADHPESRYVPNVLYIQALALDTRLQSVSLTGMVEHDALQRELYTDFPHVESEPVWNTLMTRYPNSRLSVAARLRVAQLRLRSGDAAGALRVLDTSAGGPTAADNLGAQPPAEPRMLLQTRPPESSLKYDPDHDLFEIRRLRELIRSNIDREVLGGEGDLIAALEHSGHAAECVEPLAELAGLDPHRALYREQLLKIAQEHPEHPLYDNLIVTWASTHPDRETRVRMLRACIERFPEGDALPGAMLELADIEIGAQDESRRATGIELLRTLSERFGDTCWGARAAELLPLIAPPSATPTQPVVRP
jgi:hypothetical protein